MAKTSGSAGVMSSQLAKPAKPAPDFAMPSIAARRHQLGAQRAEQVDIGDQEILDPALAGDLGQFSHRLPPA